MGTREVLHILYIMAKVSIALFNSAPKIMGTFQTGKIQNYFRGTYLFRNSLLIPKSTPDSDIRASIYLCQPYE